MAKSKAVQGNAYLVTNTNWAGLAPPIRVGVEEGFKTAFSQYFILKIVSPAQIPTQLNFVDVIVRLGSNKAESLRQFNSRVWQQLSIAMQRFSTTPQSLRARSITASSFDIGVAVALKDPNSLPSVCISEGIVSLEGAWAAWKFFRTLRTGKAEHPGPVGSKLSQKELKSFGVSLGRCMAHEAWHQIILTPWGLPPYGNPHPYSAKWPGLENESCGSDWWKDKASFGDKGTKLVHTTMTRLNDAQGSAQTLGIFRG